MVRVGEVQEGVDMERREEFISPRAANSRGRSEVGGGGRVEAALCSQPAAELLHLGEGEGEV